MTKLPKQTVGAGALGNIMCQVLTNALDGGVSSTRYGEMDMQDFDEAEIALAIKRLLATKTKRFIIDVKYE